MKHQQVNVDYWAMFKAMVTYVGLTAMGWLVFRMFNTVFMLPRRMRSQQESMQQTLQELQRKFPDLSITEEDLKNAEKELEEYMKESDIKDKLETNSEEDNKNTTESPPIEEKKTI